MRLYASELNMATEHWQITPVKNAKMLVRFSDFGKLLMKIWHRIIAQAVKLYDW